MKIFILLTFAGLVNWQNEPDAINKDFVEDVVKYYGSQTSISYNIDYRIKLFDSDDTLKINSKCKLIRNTKDSLFGGELWYDGKIGDEAYEKYYDLHSIYRVNHKDKSIVRYDPETEAFGITGNHDGQVANTCFFKPNRLLAKINDPGNLVVFKDTVMSKMNYLQIIIKSPDTDELKENYNSVFINKATRLIEKITFRVVLADQYQYNEWNLKNIAFDKITSSELKSNFNARTLGYSIQEFEPASEDEIAPLDNGIIAPDFSGISDAGKPFTLNALKGKIVILDFWYMACYPCVKSIPHLVDIQNKFKNQDVVVVGVNAVDLDTKAKQKVSAFIQKNQITYPIVFIDSTVVKQFNVHAYPTVYIIDKNGIIQASYVGFDESYQQDLQASILKLKM